MSLIKSFAVNNGDMFYINHNSDNFTIIDCNLSDRNEDKVIQEIKSKSKEKGIIRFISTHPDEDHISGLIEIDKQIGIPNFYCVENKATKEEPSKDFKKYCELRNSEKSFYIEKKL